ncbi:MAG: hypothetical protein WC155_03230 [Candidatus Cloacimonadales bacterium]
MKKYLLSSLFIFLIAAISASSPLVDMRVGDFGCITRVVFEFNQKVDYQVKESDNKLSISLSSNDATKIKATKFKSTNIRKLDVTETATATNILFELAYPVKVTDYNYKERDKQYIIMFDIYDKQYLTDKDKGLTALLFKGQKFPIAKISTEIATFLQKYPNDDKVNFYLGMMYGYRKDKVKATNLLTKIPKSSDYYTSAQESLTAFSNNNFPQTEVKPNYWEIERAALLSELASAPNAKPASVQTNEAEPEKVINSTTQTDMKKPNEATRVIPTSEPQTTTQNLNIFQQYWFFFIVLIILCILIIIIQQFMVYKAKLHFKEAKLKLDSVMIEKNIVEHKLKQGIIESSKTQDKIIIKLFNNGWSAEDIASELNASLEAVEATIKREGRL